MHPKWDAINGVDNLALRVALYTSEGQERVKLEGAFPECFTETENNTRIPGSVIKRLAQEDHAKGKKVTAEEAESLSHTDWLLEAKRLGAVTAFEWQDDDGRPVPLEVRTQVVGKPLAPWMTVNFLGEQFLICYMRRADNAELKIGDIIPSTEYDISLIHTRFIDTEA